MEWHRSLLCHQYYCNYRIYLLVIFFTMQALYNVFSISLLHLNSFCCNYFIVRNHFIMCKFWRLSLYNSLNIYLWWLMLTYATLHSLNICIDAIGDSLSQSTSFNQYPMPLSSLSWGPMPISNSSRNFELDVITVGQCYVSATQFKEALCDYAINRNFNFHFVKKLR